MNLSCYKLHHNIPLIDSFGHSGYKEKDFMETSFKS